MARVGLSSNRKFLRLARALASKPLARGVLEVLWEPCFEVGDPYVGTSDDIEALCEWKGERGALTQALLDAGLPKGAGFIEPYEGSVRDSNVAHYQVHDFFHHCPEYAKTRKDRELENTLPKTCAACGGPYYSRNPKSQFCGPRCRVNAHRATKACNDLVDIGQVVDGTGNETICNDVKRSVTICNGTPTPVRVRTSAVRVRTPKESTSVRTPLASRRKSVATPVASPADADGYEEGEVARPHHVPQDATTVAPSPEASPVVLTFPVVGPAGPSWPLRESQIAHWRTLYPNVDVLSETRQALAWVEADPARRKTFGGMLRFLVSWLNRSVDSTRTRGPTMITGSLKTAGNKAAIEEFLRRRGHVMD